MTEVTWYVPGNNDPEDAKTTKMDGWYSDGRDAAKEIGATYWHRHGDYCQEFEVAILAPEEFAGVYTITVESEPVFYAGERRKPKEPTP